MMQVTFIIPAVNESRNITGAVERAWDAGADEVIVVDGGSTDETVQLARNSNCSLLTTTPGRAKQLNHGAANAHGDVVLFLHADNWLAPEATSQVRRCLARHPDILGGAFRQKITSPHGTRLPLSLKIIQHGNAFRARVLQMPYGDQGVFVRNSVFESLGGFPDQPLMEDYQFAINLKRLAKSQSPGQRAFALLDGPLYVNPRRWLRHGPIRQTLRNWSIIIAYQLGVPPRRLANFYRRHDT